MDTILYGVVEYIADAAVGGLVGVKVVKVDAAK